jgi:hypothetical protein
MKVLLLYWQYWRGSEGRDSNNIMCSRTIFFFVSTSNNNRATESCVNVVGIGFWVNPLAGLLEGRALPGYSTIRTTPPPP